MATNENLRALLRARGIELDDDPVDYTLDDLATWSVERSELERRGSALRRTLDSAGTLRMFGEQVSGNRAAADAVAAVLSAWQRLITAAGAAIDGIKTGRGKLPAVTIQRTTLDLVASPGPGSLVLNLTPRLQGFDDVYPKGEPIFDEGDRALVDLAVGRALDLLGSVQGVVQDELASMLIQDGPRVATALKAMLSTMASESLDADFTWREPGRSGRRLTLTGAEARDGLLAIRSRRLDAEPLVLRGQLRTISLDRKLELLTSLDGEEVSLQLSRGEVSENLINALHTGTFVEVSALMFQEIRPGGQMTTTYEATSIEIFD